MKMIPRIKQACLHASLIQLAGFRLAACQLTCSGEGVWCRDLVSPAPVQSPQFPLHRAGIGLGWVPKKQDRYQGGKMGPNCCIKALQKKEEGTECANAAKDGKP